MNNSINQIVEKLDRLQNKYFDALEDYRDHTRKAQEFDEECDSIVQEIRSTLHDLHELDINHEYELEWEISHRL